MLPVPMAIYTVTLQGHGNMYTHTYLVIGLPFRTSNLEPRTSNLEPLPSQFSFYVYTSLSLSNFTFPVNLDQKLSSSMEQWDRSYTVCTHIICTH